MIGGNVGSKVIDKTNRKANRISLLAGLFSVVLCVQAAHASLIAYDDFSYAAGSSLVGENGGQGFSGAWYEGGYNVTQALTTVGSGSLTYPPLVDESAGKAERDG